MSAAQQADARAACVERCAELRAKQEKLLRESSITEEDKKKLQATVDANAEVLADMGRDADEAAARRLKQEIAISELKGTVRVIARVCSHAVNQQSGSVTSGPSSTGVDDTINIMPPQTSAEAAAGQAFVFDKVIPAQASTAETFKHLRDLVERAVAGEQVCIFACGHSGSRNMSVLGGATESTENVCAAIVCAAVIFSNLKLSAHALVAVLCLQTLVRIALEHLLDATTQESDWTYSTAASLAVRSCVSVSCT